MPGNVASGLSRAQDEGAQPLRSRTGRAWAPGAIAFRCGFIARLAGPSLVRRARRRGPEGRLWNQVARGASATLSGSAEFKNIVPASGSLGGRTGLGRG